MKNENNKCGVAIASCQNDLRRESSKKAVSKPVVCFWLLIALILVLGSFLRLYLISDQVLLDDEWHGMDYAIGNSFVYLLTHFSVPGATSVPMNLYRWFLLNTYGWSEILLRFPSLLAGVLSLIVFPLLVKKIFNRRATVIFAFLFAISPFLVFYSRVSRPYSMAVLLGFVSIMSLYLWSTNGKRKYAVLYVITGVLAVYFHLFALIAVLSPLVYVLLIKLIQRFRGSTEQPARTVPDLSALVFSAVSLIVLLSVLLLPLMQSFAHLQLNKDQLTLKSLFGFAGMLSGTSNEILVFLFWFLLLTGIIILLRRKSLFGGISISVFVLYFLGLFISSAKSINAPIVISRYIILIYPISFILVAVGIDGILKYVQSIKPSKGLGYNGLLINLLPTVFLVVLFFGGPLIKVYARPNNFTNHSAFQESYQPLDWERSYISDIVSSDYVVKKSDIPDFYNWLSDQSQVGTIIEYPMILGDHFNLYYYYQHFHKKRIIAGYFTHLPFKDIKSTGYIVHYALCDYVLFRVPETSKLKFRNMVDVMNIEAVRKSQADYIILHKNLMAEMFPQFFSNKSRFKCLSTEHLSEIYETFFGSPVFKDKNLIVFRILHM